MGIGSSAVGFAVRKVFRFAWGFAEKFFCRKAYQLSTNYHDHRVLVEDQPTPLGDYVGYKLYWDEYLQGTRLRAPRLELRAAGDQLLKKVVVHVEASNEKGTSQDEVTLRNVDERSHCATLSSVPFRHPEVEGNMVRTPYDTIRVTLIEIKGAQGQDLLPPWPIVDAFDPMDDLAVAMGLERGYVEKWGRVYHLRFVEMAITEQLVRLSARRMRQSRLMNILWAPLRNRRVATVLFWLKNARHARPLKRELVAHIAEYNEYIARRKSKKPEIAGML